MRRTSNAGFTMIEAIVIIAVIAILGGILTPMVIKEVGKSKITRAKADMEAVSTAFNQYFADTGVWPNNWSGATDSTVQFLAFTSLFTNSSSLTNWDGPYFERSTLNGGVEQVALNSGGVFSGFVDPWGRPFSIVFGRVGGAIGGTAGAVAIVSGGPDKAITTTGANACMGIPANDDLVRVITRRVR